MEKILAGICLGIRCLIGSGLRVEQTRLTLRGSGALEGMAAGPSLALCLIDNLGWRHINLQVDLSGASVEPPRQTEDAQPSGMLRAISIVRLSPSHDYRLYLPQGRPRGLRSVEEIWWGWVQ